ncbi:aminoglycoside phosphotransferase family protein [Tenuibacillus multivorans]|uniref:Phosphotransferase enzyme family protein n=1 Tax=Tenuibacillus multivorans TaxID=237069 RepID=A0A1G9WLY5_9BACI|nr:aminoglycoside phosphotransferase family protein [Tenuibacillus multivorans]GEL78020.1 hypothetical protein TMU01_22550 [Tenuibacillus multivorans]SDM85263.1 Phosphotransferase enzyme family protein [Tenuibacillus multivorans]
MTTNWTYKLIVMNNTNEILLDSVSLPTYSPEVSHVAVINHINDYLNKNYNIKTNVLRCLKQEKNVRSYEVEVVESCSVTNATWVDSTEALRYLNDLDQSLLSEWLSNSEEPVVPWFKPGWREEMEQWIKNVLQDQTVEIEQIRSWERSALFKVIAKNRNYYFKAVPIIFSHEPSINQFLDQHHASYVPEVIAVHPQNNWYLMQELQGPLLGKTNDLHQWEQALIRLVDIQKKSTLHITNPSSMYCPTRPVTSTIQHHLETALYKLYQHKEISTHTYNVLLESVPNIFRKCDQLQHSNIPLALEHGDFFGGNIIIHQDGPVIYDWSDSTLSHPFLSVMVLLEEVEHLFSKEAAKRLLDEYLEYWCEFDSKDRLYDEYKLLKTISPAYYLTVYQTYIFTTFKDNWDKQQIVDEYVRQWII